MAIHFKQAVESQLKNCTVVYPQYFEIVNLHLN